MSLLMVMNLGFGWQPQGVIVTPEAQSYFEFR